MAGRSGPGTYLTSLEAQEQLTLPVVYILAGKAFPVFPKTSGSRPSPFVIIQVKSRMANLDAPLGFPITVNGEQWRNAVVPVIEDERWRPREPLFARAIQDGRIKQFLDEVGAALRFSFQQAGYGP